MIEGVDDREMAEKNPRPKDIRYSFRSSSIVTVDLSRI